MDTLDRQNIAINKQYGIEAPQNGLANGLSSLTGIVGQVLGPKLQLLGPKIQAVTGLLGGSSGGGSGGQGGGSGSGLGSIISLVTSLSGSSSGGAGASATVETVDSSEEDDSWSPSLSHSVQYTTIRGLMYLKCHLGQLSYWNELCNCSEVCNFIIPVVYFSSCY